MPFLGFAEPGPVAESCRGWGDPQISPHWVSLTLPYSSSGVLGCMEQPSLFFSPSPRHQPAFPFALRLPGTRRSVAGAGLLALGRLHPQQLRLLLPGLGRWQAGQVAACKAARRKTP